MSVKFTDFHKGLDEIEKIDKQIEMMLESENYSGIIEIMKERLAVISQLTRIKGEKELTESMKLRLNQIFNSAAAVHKKVQIKKQKIDDRLKSRKKVTIQNKKIAY